MHVLYVHVYMRVYTERMHVYKDKEYAYTHISKEREQVMQTLVHIMGSGPLKSSINVEWCP